MKMKYLRLVSLIMSLVSLSYSEYNTEDCMALGFNPVSLLCSTCDKFELINEPEIQENCKQCCLKDDDDSRRYPRAVLDVCTCKFSVYPQIQAFIKSDRPKKYKNLSIKYSRGADPTIRLYNYDDTLGDILDIHKWDTDSVDEFLRTHLVMD